MSLPQKAVNCQTNQSISFVSPQTRSCRLAIALRVFIGSGRLLPAAQNGYQVHDGGSCPSPLRIGQNPTGMAIDRQSCDIF
jgi:hypothetical protein